MGDDEDTTDVLVVLDPDPGADGEELEVLVRQLRTAIIALDVDSVTRASDGDLPEGAKGDPVTIGALVVALSTAGGVLPSLIDVLRDWLERRNGRHRISVTVGGDSIDVERASRAEQQQLIDAFLRARDPG